MKINYFMIPSEITERKDLSSTDKLISGLIATFTQCNMTQLEIANHLGLNQAQVSRSIKRLKEKGIVKAIPKISCLMIVGNQPFKQLQNDYITAKRKRQVNIIPNPEIKALLDQVYQKRRY